MAFDITKLDFILPNGWELVRLGDIADINANTISKKDKFNIIKYIDISSISTHSMEKPKEILFNEAPSRARRKLKNNDFIISTVRPNLKQYVFLKTVEPNWIASTGFCVVSAKNSKHSWYLYSLVTSEKFTEYLSRVANGGAYPAFNPVEIEDAIIPLPDDKYLGLINSFAQNINEKIQLNTQTNQTLEAIAQAIFKSWFVDFDPVRAKAQAISDGKTSDEANLSAMAVISGKAIEDLSQTEYQQLWEIADAFPSELVENAEFGKVPKGWKITKIENVIKKISTGKKYSQKTAFSEGNIPILDQGRSGYIGYHNDEAGVKASIQDPVIVFANHTCYMRLITYDFSAIQNVFAFKGNECNIYWLYLATLGKQKFTEYKGHFPDFLIKNVILPAQPLIDLFGFYVETMFSQIAYNNSKNEILSKTRDLLLPKLLNGEV